MSEPHEESQQQQQPLWTKLDHDEIHIDTNNRNYRKITFEQVRASEHLSLCSSSNSQFHTNCFTGVRVYDGSKIMAAFLLSNKHIQKYLSQQHQQEEGGDDEEFSIVELGCGCGLSGVAASEVILTENENDKKNSTTTSKNNNIKKYSLTFTDMQPSCLEIAKNNVERVKENHQTNDGGILFRTDLELLRWDEEGVQNFFEKKQQQQQQKKSGFSLILGAELVYFRVDLHALLFTIKSLLLGEPAHKESGSSSSSSRRGGICLLCHVNRLTGGRQELPRLLRSDQYNLAFRNVSMDGALAACEAAKYFDHAMTQSFLDRVDFLAIALSEEDLAKVFGADDENQTNYDNEKNVREAERERKKKEDQEKEDAEFLGKMGSGDLF